MVAKFNLYDFIANLIPGAVFLWALEWMGTLVGWSSPFPLSGQLAETSLLVALSYVTGLMLQAVSERFTQQKVLFRLWNGFPSARWLLPDDPRLSGGYKKRVLDLIAERFKVPTAPEIPDGTTAEQERELRLIKNQELFYLCYNYVDNLNPRPEIFNAQYGLFRCLLTLFAVLCALAIVVGLWNVVAQPTKQWAFLVTPFIFAFLGWLFYERCKKRADDFAKSVYDLFLSGAAVKPST